MNVFYTFAGSSDEVAIPSSYLVLSKERLKFTEIIDGSNEVLRVSACLYRLAWRLHTKEEDFLKAFELLEQARFNLEENGLKNSALYAMVIDLLAANYYRFFDFEQAKNYYFTWLIHPKKYSFSIQGSLNNFALSLERLERYEQAIPVYLESLKVSEMLNDSILLPLVHGNLSFSLYNLGYTNQAVVLLNIDFKGSLQVRSFGSAANALLTYLKIDTLMAPEVRFNLLEKVSKLYDYSYETKYWELLYLQSRWYFDTGDFLKAYNYLEASQNALNELRQNRDKNRIHKIGFEVFKEKTRAEFNEIELRAKNTRLVYVYSAVLVVTLLIYLLFAYLRENKLNIKRILINQYRAAVVKRELEHKNETLLEVTRSLSEKNDSLKHLENLLLMRRDSDATTTDGDPFLPNKLLDFSILTEEDWHEFKKLFSSVYPNFLSNLSKHHPELTDAEKRHACLLRLNKSSYDIAALLAISKDSVRKSNHRLRQKLGFSEQTEMIEFLFSITA